MLSFAVYASSATDLFTNQDLLRLLAQSRQNNQKLGLTGMLLYKGGNFLQVLEGEEPVVKSLLAKIQADRRHTGFLPLMKGTIAERRFPNWTMGFRNLDLEAASELEGYSSFLNKPFSGEEFTANPSIAHRLLLSFKQGMR